MAYSDDFIRQLRKRSEKSTIKASTLRSMLFNNLEGVPEDLGWDIFNLFFPDTGDDSMLNSETAERLALVIDLFVGEYDENNIELTDEELEYISDGVNDYALELTDDILMNVMKAAVARGLMG